MIRGSVSWLGISLKPTESWHESVNALHLALIYIISPSVKPNSIRKLQEFACFYSRLGLVAVHNGASTTACYSGPRVVLTPSGLLDLIPPTEVWHSCLGSQKTVFDLLILGSWATRY
jgi:hypothetical protein